MQNLKQKAKELNPAFYMTIVSIIQSFALSFLLTAFGDSAAVKTVLGWLQAVAVFQIIVMTWHVNVQHATIFARVYDWADSYIPFLFAIPEYLMIVCIKNRSLHWWFFWVALFTAMALAAYMDTFRDTQREPENAAVFARLRLYRVGILWYFASGAVLFLFMGIFTPTTVWVQSMFVVVINLLFIIFAFVHHRYCWKKVIDEPSNR